MDDSSTYDIHILPFVAFDSLLVYSFSLQKFMDSRAPNNDTHFALNVVEKANKAYEILTTKKEKSSISMELFKMGLCVRYIIDFDGLIVVCVKHSSRTMTTATMTSGVCF